MRVLVVVFCWAANWLAFLVACGCLLFAVAVFFLIAIASVFHLFAWCIEWSADFAEWWGASLTWPEFMDR